MGKENTSWFQVHRILKILRVSTAHAWNTKSNSKQKWSEEKWHFCWLVTILPMYLKSTAGPTYHKLVKKIETLSRDQLSYVIKKQKKKINKKYIYKFYVSSFVGVVFWVSVFFCFLSVLFSLVYSFVHVRLFLYLYNQYIQLTNYHFVT